MHKNEACHSAQEYGTRRYLLRVWKRNVQKAKVALNTHCPSKHVPKWSLVCNSLPKCLAPVHKKVSMLFWLRPSVVLLAPIFYAAAKLECLANKTCMANVLYSAKRSDNTIMGCICLKRTPTFFLFFCVLILAQMRGLQAERWNWSFCVFEFSLHSKNVHLWIVLGIKS